MLEINVDDKQQSAYKEIMKAPTHKELVDYINRHLEDIDEKQSTFGRRVLNDSGAMSRLLNKEKKRDPRLSTVNTILDAIEKDKEDASST